MSGRDYSDCVDGMSVDNVDMYSEPYEVSHIFVSNRKNSGLTNEDNANSVRGSKLRRAFKSRLGSSSQQSHDTMLDVNDGIIRPTPVLAKKLPTSGSTSSSGSNVRVGEYSKPKDFVSFDWEEGQYCDPEESCSLHVVPPSHLRSAGSPRSAFDPACRPSIDEKDVEEEIYELARNIDDVMSPDLPGINTRNNISMGETSTSIRLNSNHSVGDEENYDRLVQCSSGAKNIIEHPSHLKTIDPSNDTDPGPTYESSTPNEVLFRHNKHKDQQPESPLKKETELYRQNSYDIDLTTIQVPASTRGINNVGSKSNIDEGEGQVYEEPWDSPIRQKHFEDAMVEIERSSLNKLDQRNSDHVNTQISPSNSDMCSETNLDAVTRRAISPASQQRYDISAPNPATYEEPWDFRPVQFGAHTPGPSVPSPLPSRGPSSVPRTSAPVYGSLVEHIDSSTPLKKQEFFHRRLSRGAADNLILRHKPGSYLIRPSETQQDSYSLSVKSAKGSPMHLRITKVNDKYILGENSNPFDSIPDMIQHYTTHHLPIKNIEKICLMHPIRKHSGSP
ncbi:hypothetical protein ScPMuIL_017567 [Solemya velum]